MRHSFSLPCSVVCLLVSIVPVAAAEKTGGAEYFPLQVGNEWNYDVKTSYTGIDVTNDSSVTEKVIKISDDKPALVTYEAEGAGGTFEEIVSVTKEGVYRHEMNGYKITPPLRFIAFPLKAGAKWTTNGKTEGIAINNKYTCTVEKVKVPAGEFECFVISGGNDLVKVKTWLAPNVGKVKHQIINPQQVQVFELESYKIADAPK